MPAPQKILVFDSGLGGLTVFRAIRALRPDADYLYLADDALFPYGALAPDVLIARVIEVIDDALAAFSADCIVIACNTASTLVLPPLRARLAIPIVGTVPAIKPAAASTISGLISVLATPGTVSRDYTAELIREFASGLDVTLVGSKHLAGYAEAFLRGETIDDIEIAAEIGPCFVDKEGRRTDAVVLACTHYPLLLARFEALAPWPVAWVDPAPAIARRVVQVIGEARTRGQGRVAARFTAGEPARAVMAAAFGSIAALPA
jgi:glutamate racemase